MQDISRIPTERLLPNPYQPRHKFDSEEMLELADSIKAVSYTHLRAHET